MTENRRIVLNTVVTYGRSLLGVLCGIFSMRWVLEALGQVDFGLYGLIGSMAMFIGFLNIQFASAIARYYAYAVGEAKAAKNAQAGLEECRAWFSVAVLIHTILPTILVIIGYPVGIYVIQEGMMNIPAERIGDCIWLWRFVCLSCWVLMINVPFSAMYTAKQYIAELTIYSLLQTILRTLFAYYMVCVPRNWLVGYGFGMLLVSTLPAILLCFRACVVFPECRIRFSAMRHLWRVVKLGSFAFWQGVGGMGFIASHQGMSILINAAFGPRITGSFSISQTVSAEAASLTGALQGALAPAITTACGAGDQTRMQALAFKACRYGTLLTLLFAVPMAMEIETLLRVWLKNPPPSASGMCVCALAFIVIEKLSTGNLLAVNASGRVSKFQAWRGCLRVLVLPFALLAVLCRANAIVTTLALPLSAIIVVACDVFLSRRLVGMQIRRWLRQVLIPTSIVCVTGVLVGVLPRVLMSDSFVRLVVTTCVSLLTMAVSGWLFAVQENERRLLWAHVKTISLRVREKWSRM